MYRLELTKCTYQQVGPPFIGSGQQLMPGISSYYQRLRAVGKSGSGWWGDKGRKGAQCDKEADFKSNISLHLRIPFSNNFFSHFYTSFTTKKIGLRFSVV